MKLSQIFSNPKTYTGNKVPKQTKWVYSTVATFRDAAYALISLFLVSYAQYSGVLGQDTSQFPAMLGVMTGLIIGYRIFDAINDPWMGALIEKVHFKFGKYKPWIMIGGASSSVITLLLFVIPWISPAFRGWGYIGWFAVLYLLWGMAFTINDISYWGLLPSLTNDEKQRTAITTIMNIFCCLGQFAVAGLLPILSGSLGYKNTFIVAASIISALLLISQLLAGFGIIEHKRDVDNEKKQKVATVTEMFKILKNDKQVRIIFLVLFFYYLGSGILNTLGLNYFYFSVDFSHGSNVMTYFTVVYGLGMIISEILYPLLSSKFTRKQLMDAAVIATIVGYICFFIYGIKLGNGNYLSPDPVKSTVLYMIPLVIIGLIIFFAQGIFYMALLIMSEDVIEYHEYHYGERKEGVIFALRPFATKFASSLQQGVLYLFLMVSGLYEVVGKISSAQYEATFKTGDEATKVLQETCDAITKSTEAWQPLVFKIGVAIVPMISIVVAYIIYRKCFVVDEKMFKELCEGLEKRKAEQTNSTENNETQTTSIQ